MISKLKTLIAAVLLVGPLALAGPAHAQARGVGVVSIDAAIQGTTAYQNAVQQIQTTYATQIQQAQTRAQQLEAELQPLQQAFQQAQQAPNATQESIRPAYEALATRQQAAQQELQQLQRPVALAQQYVREQIAVHAQAALTAAMSAANVDLVLEPDAVTTIAPNSPANLTSAVTTQLNARVTTAQITPPEGWSPGDTLRASQQQQQQQNPAQTEGR